MMKNPAPWASFDHFGVYYVNHCQTLLHELSVPVIYIQRWWRQRHEPRKKLYPIHVQRSFKTVQETVAKLKKGDALLCSQFRAFEKLDGTNFGIRCDGEMFGRRYRVEGDTYQRVPLVGRVSAIPGEAEVTAVKHAMIGEGFDNVELFLYGELMCNPGKFDYKERAMGHKFFCFGAMITSTNHCTEILAKLLEKGFVAYLCKDGQIRVTMNEIFSGCIEKYGVLSAPLLEAGPLRDLCFRVKNNIMMKDGMEGVVLTSDTGGLFKWKTSTS